MLVKDFKETQGYRFPEEFLELLPEVCLDAECGSLTEMSDVLTSLRCTNPRCPSKVAMRLLALLQDLGVKGVGAEKARAIVSEFELDNPALIFGYNFDEDGCLTSKTNESISRSIQAQLMERNKFTLSEFVKICQLPNIQSSAGAIFSGYSNLTDAYADIEAGGIDFIRTKLGIKKTAINIDKEAKEYADKLYNLLTTEDMSDALMQEVLNADDYGVFEGYSSYSSIRHILENKGVPYIVNIVRDKLANINKDKISIKALKIYNTLIAFKNDLFEAIQFVNIIDLSGNSGVRLLKVACSTEVGGQFKKKADFYAYVNDKYKDKVHVEFLKSVNKSIDYLVWSGGSNPAPDSTARVTNKVLTVRGYNEDYNYKKELGVLSEGEHYIPILSADEFLQELDRI